MQMVPFGLCCRPRALSCIEFFLGFSIAFFEMRDSIFFFSICDLSSQFPFGLPISIHYTSLIPSFSFVNLIVFSHAHHTVSLFSLLTIPMLCNSESCCESNTHTRIHFVHSRSPTKSTALDSSQNTCLRTRLRTIRGMRRP